ncbi:NUDIX hydrolase [Streptomyces platensis]|uniref:NUDIX hydrolase n=1 Tax=Streptomyces platensis TaxID=58346 RepID=UPI002E823B35|nr:NUDIX hydrolase [Streptomyces platensis]WTI54503.1 NUDIX hydrolase [Streptomyces platensis]WUB79872.1 NUDIX hydrolase [Streptomyces platensis]
MTPTPDEPDAWYAYLAEGNARQARKRVAADVLLRNASGHFLLVKPTYKPGWDLPGGMAEANEPPEQTAMRELKEELGLAVALHGFLVVDWVAPHEAWDDQLAFIFDGGVLAQEVVDELRPHDEELSRLAFVSKAEALTMLPRRMVPRFVAATEALTRGTPHYLHNGSALP